MEEGERTSRSNSLDGSQDSKEDKISLSPMSPRQKGSKIKSLLRRHKNVRSAKELPTQRSGSLTRKLRRSSMGPQMALHEEPQTENKRFSARFFDRESSSPSKDLLLNIHSGEDIGMSPAEERKDSSPFPAIPKDVKKDITKFQLEDYAKIYFQTRKKGIFQKKVPLQEMLTFQKKPLTAPLLQMPRNSPLVKQALAAFERILTYQEIELPTKKKGSTLIKDRLRVAQQLVTDGIQEGQLRDEIFCQLCKQTCDAPERDFTLKGWELLSFCCLSFPPTKNFEGWLCKYLKEHISCKDEAISKSAMYSLRKLQAICNSSPSQRIPTLSELEKIRLAPFGFSPFGATLEELMEYQKEKYPDLDVPYILIILCKGIVDTGGERAQGIFRVKGESKLVNELRAEFEGGNYEVSFPNAHVPATLLKLWARELSAPMIPYALYPMCIQAGDNATACSEIVARLPALNRRVLGHIVQLLQRLVSPENAEINKMTPESIAAVLAPSVVRSPSGDPQEMLANSPAEQAFVRSLIIHLEHGGVL